MLKLKGSKAKKAKSFAEGPNPRVPHLVLPPELGSEDCRANPWRQLDLGRHDTILIMSNRDLR